MFNWFRSSKKKTPKSAVRRPQRARLEVELLEDRCLLSVAGPEQAIAEPEPSPVSATSQMEFGMHIALARRFSDEFV